MEEINLHELFDYFKERIMLFLVVLLVAVVCGSFYSVFLKTPLYKSNTTIILVSEDGKTTNQSYSSSDVQLNKSLVGTYSEIIKSRKVVEQVIKNLSLESTFAELSSRITVASVNDTEVIKVTVADVDRSTAADVANEIVKVFSEEVKETYQIQNVSVLDEAQEEEYPYNINLIKDLIIYILVGIILGLAIIFVIYYFDTTVKSAEEIEEKFGLPIFGVVPKVKSRGDK